jgi:cytochrome c biogenesis protein CcdA
LFQQNGEKFLGPLLIIMGMIMLNVIKLNFLGKSNIKERFSDRIKEQGLWGSFLLGVVFALAFCPYSGALYFGMLIPMTISSATGLYLPFVFAIGTGLPVILFTYLLTFAVHQVSGVFNQITKIEKGMRYVTGVVFILAGIYYVSIFAGLI